MSDVSDTAERSPDVFGAAPSGRRSPGVLNRAGALDGVAGVVDQGVNSAEPLQGLFYHLLGGVGLGDSERYRRVRELYEVPGPTRSVQPGNPGQPISAVNPKWPSSVLEGTLRHVPHALPADW